MANRKDAQAVLVVGALSVVVAIAGLYLGFHSKRHVQYAPPAQSTPETGPILYEMRSVRSDPDRVRLEWKEVAGAGGYRITLMSAVDESLATSPTLATTAWVIPPETSSLLKPQTVYHWRLTVLFPNAPPAVSEAASFATQ